MTIERRQFLPSSLIGNSGLNRELSVDDSLGTLRVHTTAKPDGIPLATKSDTQVLSNNLTTLGNNMSTGMNDLQNQIDRIHIDTNGTSCAVSGFEDWVANTDVATNEQFPYMQTVTLLLDKQLTADQIASLSVYILFNGEDIVAEKYASFCSFTGVLDNVTGLYDLAITVYSRVNTGTLSFRVIINICNTLTPPQPPVYYTFKGTLVGDAAFDRETGILNTDIDTVDTACASFPAIYGNHWGSYEIKTMFRLKQITADNQPLIAIKDGSIIMVSATNNETSNSMLIKVWRNSEEQEVTSIDNATIYKDRWYVIKLLATGYGCSIQLEDDQDNVYTLWSGLQIYNLWTNDLTWFGGCFDSYSHAFCEFDMLNTWLKTSWDSTLNDWKYTIWVGAE